MEPGVHRAATPCSPEREGQMEPHGPSPPVQGSSADPGGTGGQREPPSLLIQALPAGNGVQSGRPSLACSAPRHHSPRAPAPREGPAYLFGELFCPIVEVGFHQSERIDAFHVAGNKQKLSFVKNGWEPFHPRHGGCRVVSGHMPYVEFESLQLIIGSS